MADLDGDSAAAICNDDGGGAPDPGTAGAPSDARYWVGAAHAGLSAEHNLGALATGLVINTAGVPSIAAAGTDYVAPSVQIIAGAGLTGGGTLAADRTLNVVAADVTITVNADSIQVGEIANANVAAAAAIAHTKLANLAGLSVLGRSAGTSGAMAAITAGQNGHVLQMSGGTLSFGFITGTTSLITNSVGNAQLRQSAALSVVGNSTNATANVADILAGTDGFVLRRSGTALGFGLLVDANIDAAAAIAHSKLAAAAGASVLGRSAGSSGALAPILSGADGQVLIRIGGAVNFGQLTASSAVGTQTDGFVLTLVTGIPTWAAASGGGSIDGSGTATHLASWTDSDTLQASGITLASNVLTHAASSSGGTVSAVASNTSNTASSKALISTLVAGTTADDAYYTAAISAGQNWSWGLDNSVTGDPFVLAANATLGTNNVLSAHPDNTTGVVLQTISGTGAKLILQDATARLQNGSNNYFHADTTFAAVVAGGSYRLRFESAGLNLLGQSAGSYGGGQGVVFVANRTTAPSSDPTGGGILYVESGALKYRGSSGTVTTIAVA